ncbi:MAG TPA: hypothetical protein VGK67_00810 [Myxococcales bacterium]
MPKTPILLWIDHQEARLCSADGAVVRTVTLALPADEEDARGPNKPMASGRRNEHSHERFYAAVAQALRGFGPLALCGPSTAKVELSKYLKRKAPELDREVIGVHTLDHPTERQLAAFAKTYFAPPK